MTNAASYLGSSTRKVWLSMFHLRALEDAIGAGRREDFFAEPGPDEPFSAIYAHADGCILQMFGSLDAFACAVAWYFGLAPAVERDRYSFGKLTCTAPPVLVASVARVAGSPHWADLNKFRHHAAHRGVIPERTRLSVEPAEKPRFLTEEGADVLGVLQGLVNWGGGAVRDLQAAVRWWPEGRIALWL